MSKLWRGIRRKIGKASSSYSWMSKPEDPGATLELDPYMARRGIVLEVKNFLNDPFVKKVIAIGGDVAAAIQPFSETPSLWNGLKVVFLTGKSLVDNLELWAHEFFDDDGHWVEPFPRDFTGAILKVLKKFPYETMKTSTEGSVIQLVKLDEGQVGWVTNTKSTFKVDRIYAEVSNVDQIKKRIELLLWEQFQGKPLVLRRNVTTIRSLDEDRVVLEVDDTYHPLPSALATQYTAYLKRALDGGVHRSVMLYGPPGTGKSTMARTLVDSLNLRSFRIRIEDVGGLETSTLFEALNIFKPDAIILDDFDRAGGQEQLLETLEHFHRHVKMVIATVNFRDQLDEALLRPGRFDELILVKRMDDNVIKSVLGEGNDDVFDLVKDWPIAFIQEYVKRRRFMSKEEAMNSIKELADRVKRLQSYDEDSDVNRVLGIKKGKKRRRGPAIDRALLAHAVDNGDVAQLLELEDDEEDDDDDDDDDD